MSPILFPLIFLLIVAATVVVFLLIKRKSDDSSLQGASILNENINKLTDRMFAQLNAVTRQVNERLKENAEILQTSNRTIGERLDNAAKVVTTVTDRLSQLEESNKRIYDVGKDIASLQEILRAPKLRGGLGELFLGDLLSQYFPHDQFEMPYTFKSGEKVDAVIKLRDSRLVPIDSKFPLENFQKMLAAQNDNERKAFKRIFVTDVKGHIDSIAKKYILPDEGTLDFALIYIHAENVYYEIITRDEDGIGLDEYARKKRVIPVSPNNFFIYIQTILFGLRGLEIEKSAKSIQKNLAHLRIDFMKFGEDFSVLGSHLMNAQSKYDQSEKRLLKFTDRLEKIHSEESEAVPLLEAEQDRKPLKKRVKNKEEKNERIASSG